MDDSRQQPPYTLEWYLDENGRDIVRDWITKELTPFQRRVIGLAMYEILQWEGEQVADDEFGSPLGDGLFEFRVRQSGDEILSRSRRPSVRERLQAVTRKKTKKDKGEEILLRVFFHPHGDKLILLLGGYDKARYPSKRRQQKEIAEARKRLNEWRRSGRSRV